MINPINEVTASFDLYTEARERLANVFGIDDLWYNLIWCGDEKWAEDEYRVQYDFTGMDDWGNAEFDYYFEIYGRSRWQAHGYVLFVGDNHCGDRDMYIFDLSKKVSE